MLALLSLSVAFSLLPPSLPLPSTILSNFCLQIVHTLIQISRATVHRILKWTIKWKPFKFMEVQRLEDQHYDQRRTFCEWLLQQPQEFPQKVCVQRWTKRYACFAKGGGFQNAMITISAFRLICFFHPIVCSSHFRPLVSTTV